MMDVGGGCSTTTVRAESDATKAIKSGCSERGPEAPVKHRVPSGRKRKTQLRYRTASQGDCPSKETNHERHRSDSNTTISSTDARPDSAASTREQSWLPSHIPPLTVKLRVHTEAPAPFAHEGAQFPRLQGDRP